MRLHALAGALLLSLTATASAEEAKPAEAPKPPPFTFAMHGFVSGSVYLQDANLGPSGGQQSLYVNAQSAAARAPHTDSLVFSGDVRQSRFNWSVAGPKVFAGATPKGVLEIDFFGGFGSGNYGDVSLTPRLRLAYAELDWGTSRVLVGQALDLIFTMAPASLAHIAFPFGYESGNIGWRRPGVFGYHTFGDKSGLNAEFAWEIGRSQWADNGGIGNSTVATANPGGDAYGFGNGEASGLPAVEARLIVANGSTFQIFTTGHWQNVDRSGVNAQGSAAGRNQDLQVIAVNAGAKLVMGPLTLAATGFTGKNTAPLVGNFLTFQANNIGDIHEYGGWVQAGFNFTKELSLWGYVGTDKPDAKDAIAAGQNKLQNVTTAGMLQYREGGYAVGLEWIHYYTKTRVPAAGTTPNLSANLDGNQWIASANYYF